VLTRADGAVLLELSRQGLTPDDVPAVGRRVLVQRIGNLGVDCTDQVHPEVAHAASLAARVVGLDIAGIDLVAEDIGRPLQEQGGAVVEVNAGPGLLMHQKPAVGTPRPVGRAIVGHLFAEGESGRIPIIGISGSRGTQHVARLVARLLQLGGRHVGLACRDGVFLDGRCTVRGNGTRFEPAQRMLTSRLLTAAVFEHDAEAILRDGLPYDRCQVGIVTDLDGAEKLLEYDITDTEQMAKVLQTQVDVVLGDGVAVLNAADPRLADLAGRCDGEVILYGRDAALPALVAHRADSTRGARAVFLRDGCAVLASGSRETRLAPLQRLAHAQPAEAESLLAAIAAAWALEIAPDLIVAGIETFDADTPSTNA
jgi:cyanophycin synthetase